MVAGSPVISGAASAKTIRSMRPPLVRRSGCPFPRLAQPRAARIPSKTSTITEKIIGRNREMADDGTLRTGRLELVEIAGEHGPYRMHEAAYDPNHLF